MNNPKPMAGVAETMAALDLSDEQWGVMSRAVGYKLREAVFERNEAVNALQQLYNCVPLSAAGPHHEAKIITSVGYWRTAFNRAGIVLGRIRGTIQQQEAA